MLTWVFEKRVIVPTHSRREADYAKESMDGFLKTVYPQMRLVTVLEFCVEMANAIEAAEDAKKSSDSAFYVIFHALSFERGPRVSRPVF